MGVILPCQEIDTASRGYGTEPVFGEHGCNIEISMLSLAALETGFNICIKSALRSHLQTPNLP